MSDELGLRETALGPSGAVLTSAVLMAMARKFPGAGSFYTYVARGIGARTGFVTGGLMFVA